MQGSARKRGSSPPSTKRVLHGAGTPLDRSVRAPLESRFGRDFSSVRVHTDPSAADIRARAWTHADHIAFAPGAYAPHTRDGLRLLTHELTHVVQQRGGLASSANHAAEAEANAVAGGQSAPVRQRGAAVQYQLEDIPFDPWPEKTAAALVRAQMPAYLAWRGTHPAGFELSKEEKDTAEKTTGMKAPEKPAPAAGNDPKFVLHDTDASMTVKHFQEKVGKKGPQGAGWVAGVPNPAIEPKKDPQLDPVETRSFYEEKRPTTTGFEKGEDIIGETTRERFSKDIWKASDPSVHGPAIDAALSGTGLSTQDAAEIKAATTKSLDKGTPTKVDGVKSTIAWTSVEICKRVTAEGADKIADADPKKHKKAVETLDARCKDEKFAKWIESRKRIGERTNVEIAEVGEGKALPNPPYGTSQYEGVANLYLKAALAALRWPFISTHRWEDRGIIGGHDDPRCFDLDNLYSVIAKKMSHPTGTIYGLEPKYGGASDKDANISWTPGMCHGKSPTQKAAEAKAKEEKAGATK